MDAPSSFLHRWRAGPLSKLTVRSFAILEGSNVADGLSISVSVDRVPVVALGSNGAGERGASGGTRTASVEADRGASARMGCTRVDGVIAR